MKNWKGILQSLLLILFFTTGFAYAGDLYITAHAGANFRPDAEFGLTSFPVSTNLEFNPGFVLGGGLGWETGSNIRIEGEVAYRLNNVSNVPLGLFDLKFGTTSFMANGYYDIPTDSPWKPYLGAGVGAAFVTAAFSNIPIPFSSGEETDMEFAYQLMGGLGYQITPDTTLTLGYRYFATTDPEYNENFPPFSVKTEFQSHEFLLGFRILFPKK